jgi:hypothetical protein
MQNRKKLYIFRHFAKSKSYFLPISIIFYLIPIKFETLKPPNVQSYTYRSMISKSYKQMSEAIIRSIVTEHDECKTGQDEWQ